MLCTKCLRPVVDAMTLNSTGIDKKLCYQSETGGDPLCQHNNNDIEVNSAETNGRTEIAISKDYPINSLDVNLLLMINSHDKCCLAIDCIYVNQIPTTARIHMKLDNGKWIVQHEFKSFNRIDSPQKEVSDSAQIKINFKAVNFVNSFMHHHPDLLRNADTKRVAFTIGMLNKEKMKLEDQINKLDEQVETLRQEHASRAKL